MRTYKSIIGLFAWLCFLPMQAQMVDSEALYIYQTDGSANIIIRSELVAISLLVRDGVMYQEVDTRSKQYYLPISKIQSISFVNPDGDTYRPQMSEDGETPTFGGAIDLGLPSGTIWASINVGASKPEEYGGYYAWGEIWQKSCYSKSWYQYYQNQAYMEIGTDISGTEYDVAHMEWGGNWVMPTLDDFQELFDNCTSEWTTLNGVNGRKFISKNNGNSIFLPAAGIKCGLDFYLGGFYYSSTLRPSSTTYAIALSFSSFGGVDCASGSREYGCSIRPVCKLFLTISCNKVNLEVGKYKTINIIDGSGTYVVESNDTEVAIATINGNVISVEGLKAGKATIKVTDTESGRTAKINVTVEKPKVADAVDLGLPSGTKWASWNVGATKPEEYGGYFAWGETEEKDNYSWSTYTHCDGSEKTCHNLGTDISGTEYDVARMEWGGNWVMPTLDDFHELFDNCTNKWTTLNGVNGCKFTGFNGNSIFLPAAGYRWDGSLYRMGYSGYFWSSTLNFEYDAFVLNFNSGDANWYNIGRSLGFTVRPVVRN